MDTKFAGFSRRDLVYSCINGHDLLVAVLTPEILQERPPAQYPVLVHWHGGGFITGHRTYAPWWPNWSVLPSPPIFHFPCSQQPRPQPKTSTIHTHILTTCCLVPKVSRARPLPQRHHHQPGPPAPPRSQRHRRPRRRRILHLLACRPATRARGARGLARIPGPKPRGHYRRQLRRLPRHADGPAVPRTGRRQGYYKRLRAPQRC